MSQIEHDEVCILAHFDFTGLLSDAEEFFDDPLGQFSALFLLNVIGLAFTQISVFKQFPDDSSCVRLEFTLFLLFATNSGDYVDGLPQLIKFALLGISISLETKADCLRADR